MHVIDLFVLALGTAVTMIVFVQKTKIEKSKVRVKVRAQKK